MCHLYPTSINVIAKRVDILVVLERYSLYSVMQQGNALLGNKLVMIFIVITTKQ